MSTNVTFNNTVYPIPAAGEVNWAALSNFLVDVGNNAQTTSAQKFASRIATSTPVTVSTTTDCVVITDLGVAGAVAVNLPAGSDGKLICIVDGKGDAATNNITITPAAGTINGAATYVIDGNRHGVVLIYKTAAWYILSEFIASSSGFIPRSQIAAGTASHVLINDGSGLLSSEASLAITRGGTGAATATAGFNALSPTTTRGDLVTRDASNNVRLALGTANQVLKSDGTDAVWSGISNSSIDPAAAIARSKLAAGTASHVVINDGSGNFSSEASLAISRGGTGQATATAGFDALAPTTTKGDVIAHNGTDNVRLAVGVNGQVLTADSTTSEGVKWADGGSGSGSGEINVITNPSAASATTGWTEGASHTRTRITSGSPLDPTISTAIELSASSSIAESSTSGVYWSVATMPEALRNKKLKVEFYCTVPSSDVWRLSVYAGATRLALSTDSSSATTLPAGFTGKFTAYFDTTSATAYSINFTKTTHSGANNLEITSVIVGPGIQPQGAVVGEWQSFTPTTTGHGTITVDRAIWRRVGSNIEILTRFTNGSTPGTESSLTLPLGLTIDTTKMTSTAAKSQIVGHAIYGAVEARTVVQPATSAVKLYLSAPTTPDTLIVDTGSTNVIQYQAIVPVSEWAGSGVVNLAQNDVEYAYTSDTFDAAGSTTVYGPAGQQTTNLTAERLKTVTWQRPIQPGDEISAEIAYNSNPNSWYPAASVAPYQLSSAGTNSTSGGIVMSVGSATTTQILFCRYASIANDDSPVNDWGTSYRWRIKKSSGGSAVGFGHATETQAGLVSTTAQSFEGLKTFGSGIQLDNDGNQTTLSVYRTGSVDSTFTWNGGTTSSTQTILITRIGRIVLLRIPIITATTGAASSSLTANTALPSWAIPTTGDQLQVGSSILGHSGTTFFAGRIIINDSGIITFQKFDLSNFPATVSATTNNYSSCIYHV